MTPPVDGYNSEYERWSNLFELAWHDPRGVDRLACPSCGSSRIRFVYLADPGLTTTGMFALWCSSCLRGFPPGYGPIPDGATVWDFSRRKTIPNYATVVEGES